MRYLGRYAASRARLLEKISSWSSRQFPEDDLSVVIDGLMAQLETMRLVNDTELAGQRSRYLARRGHAPGVIRQKLAQLGLTRSAIADAMQELESSGDGYTITLARNYARRRRLGNYRTRPVADDHKQAQKDLRTMMHAGFPPHLARRVLRETDDEDV